MPCNESYIYIPNAFTPNDDGINNELKIAGQNIVLDKMRIFNRWGELLFESEELDKGWDGSYNGKIVSGVYVYAVSYFKCTATKAEYLRGNITLLK